jgi:hypothetical protein
MPWHPNKSDIIQADIMMVLEEFEEIDEQELVSYKQYLQTKLASFPMPITEMNLTDS